MNERLLLLSLLSVFVVGSISASQPIRVPVNPQTHEVLALTYLDKALSASKSKDYAQLVSHLETASKYAPADLAGNPVTSALNMARKLKDQAQSMQLSEVESDLRVISKFVNQAMQEIPYWASPVTTFEKGQLIEQRQRIPRNLGF